MMECDRSGVFWPEELSLLAQAFERVGQELGLEGEVERGAVAALMLRLFQGGLHDEEELVRSALHLACLQRKLVKVALAA
jgi:hypothetical protein